MAWIESHQELIRHPKTKKLSRLLGVSLPTAIGHLHFFWYWALDYAPNGDLSRYDSNDIADACGWEGETNKLIDALTESGFVDQENYGLQIHDWDEYAGRLIEKREQNRERKKKSRARHADVTRQSAEIEHDDRVGHGATEPNPTVPNHTEPNQTNKERENDRDRILKLFNELEIKGGGALGLEKVYSYIGTVDIEVIELALKAAEKKHVNYFVSTINGWISEGKTTAALVNPIPTKGEYKGSSGRPSRGFSSKPSMPVVQSQGQAPEVSEEERKKMRELAKRLKEGAPTEPILPT